MTQLNNSPIAFLIPQVQRHNNRQGNVIQVVTRTKTAADKDLGIGGDVTEQLARLDPEPFVNALSIQAVRDSGGAFLYSDLKMTVSKDAMTTGVALDTHTEFTVNGDRFKIVQATPGPSAWEFVIRQKVAEVITP